MTDAHERVIIPWRDAEPGEAHVWICPNALRRAGWVPKSEQIATLIARGWTPPAESQPESEAKPNG